MMCKVGVVSPLLVSQTAVNKVPLDRRFLETQYGVILVLPQVLKIERNRCSKQFVQQIKVRLEGGMFRLMDR